MRRTLLFGSGAAMRRAWDARRSNFERLRGGAGGIVGIAHSVPLLLLRRGRLLSRRDLTRRDTIGGIALVALTRIKSTLGGSAAATRIVGPVRAVARAIVAVRCDHCRNAEPGPDRHRISDAAPALVVPQAILVVGMAVVPRLPFRVARSGLFVGRMARSISGAARLPVGQVRSLPLIVVRRAVERSCPIVVRRRLKCALRCITVFKRCAIGAVDGHEIAIVERVSPLRVADVERLV